jgi:hypothetical protein
MIFVGDFDILTLKYEENAQNYANSYYFANIKIP